MLGVASVGARAEFIKAGLIKAGTALLQAGLLVAALMLPLGCTKPPAAEESPLNIKLYQDWELQPDDTIADRKVLGGLGDITIALSGNRVYAPFDGGTRLDSRRCLVFSSPEVPAYCFRLCGLNETRTGKVNQGDVLGSGNLLLFAALRQHTNDTWVVVEPAKSILVRTLKKAT